MSLEFNTPYKFDLAKRVYRTLGGYGSDEEFTVWYKVTGYLDDAKKVLTDFYKGRWYNYRKDYYDNFTDACISGEDLVYVTFNGDGTTTLTFDYDADEKVKLPEDFKVYQESIEIRRVML